MFDMVNAPRSDVDRLDRQLRLLRSTLEAWLDVQRGWMALEPVFAAPDIQRQLPAETHAFVQVGWDGKGQDGMWWDGMGRGVMGMDEIVGS